MPDIAKQQFSPCAECERLLDLVVAAPVGPIRELVVPNLSRHVINAPAHAGSGFGGVAWLANTLGPRIQEHNARNARHGQPG